MTDIARIAAWQEMAAWCEAQAKDITETFERRMLKDGVSASDPSMCRLVGQSHAFGRMRSYIHGALAVRKELER